MAIPEPNRKEKDKECCVLFFDATGNAEPVSWRQSKPTDTMANYYCEFCGRKASSIQSLSAGYCLRHPLGPGKGKHMLYEGPEAARYVCEYCGREAPSILTLTTGSCLRHPNGPNKGNHKPFEGGLQSKYTCKYCGRSSSNIFNLTSGFCPSHPLGHSKGKHSPAR